MTVYISPNPGKSSARELALRAAQILRSHGAAVLMNESWKQSCNIAGVDYLPFDEAMEKTDVILTIGGDGTILHVANMTLNYHKPILGVNLGRCGFLATCEVDELETKLSAVARGQYSLDSRMLLYVRVLGDDSWEGHALNDVVVTKGRLQQAIDFSVYCDDILVEHFRGDGVIVATPTGSTAYSLSAGGPILAPGIESFCITPISAHSLHHRPIIYDSRSNCVIRVEDSGGPVGLFCDGKLVKKLTKNDFVKIDRAPHTITFLRKKDSNFYKRLLLKLNSGRI